MSQSIGREDEMNVATLADFNLKLPGNNHSAGDKSVSPSGLYGKASEIYRMCEYLEKNWSSLSEEKRELYKAVVYRALETKPHLLGRIQHRIQVLTAPTDALLQYSLSAWKLVNLVLDKAEEENEAFRTKLADAINEFDPNEDEMVVTPDNAVERLRELSR